jgi:uncharacterized protein YhaN
MEGEDKEQNTRIRALEQQFNELSSSVAALTAKIDTLTSLGRVIALLAGAALGVDIVPMMGGA